MDWFPFEDLIGIFETGQAISVVSAAEGTWTKGRYTAGAETETPITDAAIQVLQSGEWEEMLPEGARRHAARVLYTKQLFNTTEEASDTTQLADRIKFDGDIYEIKAKANHVAYYQYLLVKLSEEKE